ncbi:MAG: class I SAM-dependent methyltransferase [Acidobacteriota bacterium]|nr:class I SAM-dependent methyltransferase [Acidobacteriota bacterium]
MEKNKFVETHNEEAKIYDRQVKEYDSHGHDVLFGMCFEFVKPGENLLDLGIGTGLASINFAKSGLKIVGIDASSEMLQACRSKSFADQLLLHDLSDFPIPFGDSSFDHVICCGVLHFFGRLDGILNEVKRLIRKNGVFAFSISPLNGSKVGENDRDFVQAPTGWGVPIWKHSPEYINTLIKDNGFELLKEQRVLLKDADKIKHNMEFSVLVTRCVSV